MSKNIESLAVPVKDVVEVYAQSKIEADMMVDSILKAIGDKVVLSEDVKPQIDAKDKVIKDLVELINSGILVDDACMQESWASEAKKVLSKVP